MKKLLTLLILSLLALILVTPRSAVVVNYNGINYEVNPINPAVTAINTTVNQSNIAPNVFFFPPSPVYRITQGQTIYINDTIDISGMGWGTGLL